MGGALCSLGRSAASVGEEAAEGAEGSRGSAPRRGSQGTCPCTLRRRGEEGPEQETILHAAIARKGGGHRAHWCTQCHK